LPVRDTRLDIVAIGINQKCCELSGVIMALARCVIVQPAVYNASVMDSLHHCLIGGLKRQMMPSCQLPVRSGTACFGDREFISPEIVICAAANRNLENVKIPS
jgi:hypothetical protein